MGGGELIYDTVIRTNIVLGIFLKYSSCFTVVLHFWSVTPLRSVCRKYVTYYY